MNTTDKNEALIHACELGDFPSVRSMLLSGANIDAEEGYPLSMASYYNHKDIVTYLIDNGAKIDINGKEPLLFAINGGSIDILDLLLENGSDLKEIEHLSALNAVQSGSLKMLLHIKNLGINIIDDRHSYFLESARRGYLSIVKYYLEQKEINTLELNLKAIKVAASLDFQDNKKEKGSVLLRLIVEVLKKQSDKAMITRLHETLNHQNISIIKKALLIKDTFELVAEYRTDDISL